MQKTHRFGVWSFKHLCFTTYFLVRFSTVLPQIYNISKSRGVTSLRKVTITATKIGVGCSIAYTFLIISLFFSAVQFIRNHTNSQIGIDDVASAVGKSRSYITKLFRCETGKSISEFIAEAKLQDAKRLLRYSDKSLADIANYLCFSSQAYFQTVFKRKVGITPGEYRRKFLL